MEFNELTKEYLKEFQASCVTAYSNGSKAIEMATRPSVHKYVHSLVERLKAAENEIVIHHDANYTKTDRPDWRIEDPNTFGIFCFGDHKSLCYSKSLQLNKSERNQIQRYLDFGRPVFVFDGLEFIFFNGSLDNPVREEIITKPVLMTDNWDSHLINPAIEYEFRKIIENPGFRKWTESQLIEQLALRARDFAQEVFYLLDAPPGSGENNAEERLLKSLQQLKRVVEEHHDPVLRNSSSCASFISQVLTFGLFYAHTRSGSVEETPSEKRDAIKEFWSNDSLAEVTEKLRPFQSIITELSDVFSEQNLLSDWYNEVLGILSHAEFMGSENSQLDFHTLFEVFLAKFDKETQFDRGAFYTPKILAKWVVRYADTLCSEYFSGNMFEVADTIIEPCCGTGSFIEALLEMPKPSVRARVIGLEILPAPYALAHYRLSQVTQDSFCDVELDIYLTDTLSDQLLHDRGDNVNGFAEEQSFASRSCEPPVRVVIGNPPSSNHTALSAPRTIIDTLLDDFRPPSPEISDRQNIQKALNNEAYRFLRWCCERILKSDKGVFALVLPGAFARGVSFKYARKWISKKFSRVFVLEIDSDARTNDASASIFPVLQGRLVLFGVQNNAIDGSFELYHKNITKLSFMDKNLFLKGEVRKDDFEKVSLLESSFCFAPTNEYPKDKWNKYWPLVNTHSEQGIFEQKCSAIKLAPSSMLQHTAEPMLLRRTGELAISGNTSTAIEKWFKGQRKPPSPNKLTPDVKAALLNAKNSSHISRYHFRPFVHGWVLNSDELFVALSSAPGGGTRARPEIRSAFAAGAIGISLAPSPVDLGETLTRFACFSWSLPDNDIASRGNAMVYCNYFPLAKKSGSLKISSNVNDNLSSHFMFPGGDGPSGFLFYAYAILSSPSFLEIFEGVLYLPSDRSSPVRVPITNDKVLRNKVILIGREIALCENPDHDFEWPEQILHDPIEVLVDFRLKKWTFDEVGQSLCLHSDNGAAFNLRGLCIDVIGLKIAGHEVVSKWIRERTFPYLRRSFSQGDLDDLIETLQRIGYQQALISEVDPFVQDIIISDDMLIPLGI